MFLPLFIAVLLGLVSPNSSNSSNYQNANYERTTSSDQPSINPVNATGDGIGGETGQILPPKRN